MWPVAALWGKTALAKEPVESVKPAATVVNPNTLTETQAVMGLRSLLEVCTRTALEGDPSLVVLSWNERLLSAWNEGDWLKLEKPPLRGLPWQTFAHFEAVANEAVVRCWPQAGPRLMLSVHRLGIDDLIRLLKDTKMAPPRMRWATLQFERQAGGQLYTQLLGEVIQVQLDWLKAHQDRFPHRPAPRNAQVEQAHLEACQRIARAIVESVFLAIAMQENAVRQTPPQDLNAHNHTASIVALLGEAPQELPFPIRERPLLFDPTERFSDAKPLRSAAPLKKAKKAQKKHNRA